MSKGNPTKTSYDLHRSWTTSQNVSIRTTKRILNKFGLFGRVGALKPLLNNKQRVRRYKWCKAYFNWKPDQWRKVIYSDECQFQIFSSSRTYVRRPINTRFLTRYTIKTVKYGGKSLMVWGAITSDGEKILIRCPDRLDSFKYQDVLNQGLHMIYDKQKIFIQDGAPCHTSKSTIEYLERNHICYMSDWPAQSPDLNIIENIWSVLKLRVSKLKPTSLEQLWELIQSEWDKISLDYIRKLYDSIPRRISEILKSRGLNSKY
jgi:transposase